MKIQMCSLLFVHLSGLLDVTSEKLKIVNCEILQSVDLGGLGHTVLPN